MTYTSSGK